MVRVDPEALNQKQFWSSGNLPRARALRGQGNGLSFEVLDAVAFDGTFQNSTPHER